jgi:hypothetical protein
VNLANSYNVFMTTPLMELDIKLIKRMNNIYIKYIRSGKDQYLFEIKNILFGLNNTMDVKKAEEFILFYLEDDIKDKISLIIGKL